MNEKIEVGYGYKSVAPDDCQHGDEHWAFSCDQWEECRVTERCGLNRRRRHDPGPDHEIVPEDEARKFDGCKMIDGIEFYNSGTWQTASSPNFAYGHTFRRRKAKSEPAMEEGWELVPKGEVKSHYRSTNSFLGWQGRINCEWITVETIVDGITYRRPKSKPEQYGWLKVGCGVEMPYRDHFMVKLENGQKGNVYRQDNLHFKWSSSCIEIESPIAYWFRMPPAPEVEKVDACRETFLKYDKSRTDMPNFDTWKAAWQACEEHHAKGAK